jgi:hypothetical protein
METQWLLQDVEDEEEPPPAPRIDMAFASLYVHDGADPTFSSAVYPLFAGGALAPLPPSLRRGCAGIIMHHASPLCAWRRLRVGV